MNVRVRQARPRGSAGDAAGNGAVRLGVLDSLIGFHLRLAQDASFRAFARHSGQPHLKPGRFAAMTVIHDNPGISQIALSRAIARDKSSVTPLIQELHRRGLIKRQPSANDGRSISLTLTPAGEALLADLAAHAMEHDRQLDAIVGERKPEFIALLKKIADTLA
jgi:DNA-binding MarR family transcriptional regulator